MPHFTLPVTPSGPLLRALVGVSASRRQALVAANLPVPPPVPITGLIDTGASGTCLDPTVLAQLGVTPTGVVSVATPSTGATPHQAQQFDVSLFIPGSTPHQPPLSLGAVPVIESSLLAQQGFHALIGRDILSLCVMVYNGDGGFFTLAF